jgi:hypothetical protein
VQSWEHYIRDQDATAELIMLGDEAREVVAQALCEPSDTSWERLAQATYKSTECGISLYHTDLSAGRVIISSIVEGIEQTTQAYSLQWPFSIEDVTKAIDSVEQEALEIWNATHGCEECGPEDMFGYRPINPECPACEGAGEIL